MLVEIAHRSDKMDQMLIWMSSFWQGHMTDTSGDDKHVSDAAWEARSSLSNIKSPK